MSKTATSSNTVKKIESASAERIQTHTCEQCGKPFHSKREWHRFCSPKCRKASWKKSLTLSALNDRMISIEKARAEDRDQIESLEQRVKELESK